MKVIKIGQEARKKLASGAQLMADCVSPTLSPRGRNVVITRKYNTPYMLRDGVSVASQVETKDEFENAGIQLLLQAAQQTVIEVGDATTTTIILANYLIQNGMDLITDGHNPMKLRKELKAAAQKVSEEIMSMTREVKTDEEIEHIATVSSGSKELGKIVAEAVKTAGKDGQVTVEETKLQESSLERVEGMTLEKGMSHPYFRTTNNRVEAYIENPWVVILKKRITMYEEIQPLILLLASSNPDKKFVIFGDVSGTALQFLLENKLNGSISILVSDVPGIGPRKDAYLEDIATLTGGKVLETQIGMDLQTLKSQLNKYSFGIAKSVTANNKTTTILPAENTPDTTKEDQNRIETIKKEISTRIGALRHQAKTAETDYDREMIQERLAKLTTGVSVIKVGTKTETEKREQVELAKDAIGAVKAAMAEGIVPGGETTLVRASKKLSANTQGEKLLAEALEMPFYKLLSNVGVVDTDAQEVFDKVFLKDELGYDVIEEKIVDMYKAGIVDPTKVLRMALENAVNVAAQILTSDVIIADEYVDANKYELRRTDA